MGFWSKLGKGLLIGGSALATALTAGAASPALAAAIGAGTGAATGAVTGGKKGALMGALLGGVTGGFGGGAASGAGSAVKASTGQIIKNTLLNPATDLKIAGGVTGGRTGALMSLGSNFAPTGIPGVSSGSSGMPNTYDDPTTGAMANAMNLPSTNMSGVVPLVGSAATNTGNLQNILATIAKSPNGSSLLQSILGKVLSPNGEQAIGTALGAISKTQAANRGTKLDAMMAADRMKLAQQGNQRQEDQFIQQMLRQADYVKNGGYTPKDNYSTSGFMFPKFDLGVAPISDTRKQAASTLEDQLLQRLNNPMQLHNYDSQMDPSATESALDWIGPITGAIGSAQQPNSTLVGQQQPPPKAPVYNNPMTTQAPPIQQTLGR